MVSNVAQKIALERGWNALLVKVHLQRKVGEVRSSRCGEERLATILAVAQKHKVVLGRAVAANQRAGLQADLVAVKVCALKEREQVLVGGVEGALGALLEGEVQGLHAGGGDVVARLGGVEEQFCAADGGLGVGAAGSEDRVVALSGLGFAEIYEMQEKVLYCYFDGLRLDFGVELGLLVVSVEEDACAIPEMLRQRGAPSC